MTVLHLLWLPILLSAVFVFIASSIIHMALPWHKGDYGKVPDEDKVMDALRPFAIAPGDYMIPNCADMAEMRTAAFKAKMERGPRLIVTVLPNGMFGIGKSLFLWFVYVLVVSYAAAYVSLHAVPSGIHLHRQVVRFSIIAAFLGYAGALWQFSIWYRRSWLTTIKTSIDGLVFAGITAATLAWLWPK